MLSASNKHLAGSAYNKDLLKNCSLSHFVYEPIVLHASVWKHILFWSILPSLAERKKCWNYLQMRIIIFTFRGCRAGGTEIANLTEIAQYRHVIKFLTERKKTTTHLTIWSMRYLNLKFRLKATYSQTSKSLSVPWPGFGAAVLLKTCLFFYSFLFHKGGDCPPI